MKLSDKLKSIVGETSKAVDSLKEQSKIQHPLMPVDELFQRTHNSSPVFVLSTGRTGTQFLTELLSHSNQVKAYHEPDPTLNIIAKLSWQGDLSQDFVRGAFEGARYELIRNALILNKNYIETNNRVTFLADAISALYPNARFIHLVRKPESFVVSGLQRGWYENTNIHDEGRITKAKGWDKFDHIDRIAWLWAETNRWIQSFTSSLPKDKWFLMNSEDLYSDSEKTLKLCSFCQATDISRQQIEKQQAKPVNKSIQKKAVLSEEQKTQINQIISDSGFVL